MSLQPVSGFLWFYVFNTLFQASGMETHILFKKHFEVLVWLYLSIYISSGAKYKTKATFNFFTPHRIN